MTGRQSSLTDRALELVAGGMTPYRAAKTLGLALSTVYRARDRLKPRTPAAVREGIGSGGVPALERANDAGETQTS